MRKTALPSMKLCDGCANEPVIAACCTVVRVRPEEAKRIRRYVNDTGIEWQVNEGLQCGFLRDGQCSIYSVRPWVCRAFGVVQQLPCHRFPQEAVIDLPAKQAHDLRFTDFDDAFLGYYFEPGYYERIKAVLKPHGYNMEVV